jgi:hypothetical protein
MTSPNRYRQRKDANQPEIVQALEAIGCSVWVMHQPCDLLVGRNTPLGQRAYLLEVKNLKGRGKRLTPAQVEFRKSWKGPFAIVTSPEQAIAAVTA